MMMLFFLSLAALYAANVLAGAGGKAFLSDIAEAALLFAASACFTAVILQKERAARAKRQEERA